MADNNGYQPWMDNAVCRDPMFNPEWWFADTANDHDRKRAIKLCNQCYVRDECAQLGMEHTEGIWGGLTPQDRRQMRRRIK